MAVSAKQDRDMFRLTINNTDTLFRTQEGGIPSQKVFVLDESLPPQLSPNTTLYESMKNTTDKMETAMASILSFHFGINFLLSGSLQFMWGTINTLQLSVSVGLIDLNMPSNTNMLTSALVKITTFDFMKADDLSEAVFNFTDEISEPFNDNFEKLDYETHSSIVNLGSIYYMFMALAVIAVIKLQFLFLRIAT